MRRYRVWHADFDTRAFFLGYRVPDHAEPRVKEQWARNKEQVARGLLEEFGHADGAAKIARLLAIGSKPFSVLSFHNRFFSQVRDAFVIGASYPALTGACALGERILNHLVLTLRADFPTSEHFKKVARKNSFDNWEVPISALEAWEVLLPAVAEAFRELASLRNRVIHFRPEVDQDAEPLAKTAIELLAKVVENQFGTSGIQPWFIEEARGAGYIKKSAESWPFVQKIYIPNCLYVVPEHDLRSQPDGSVIISEHSATDGEISDGEFCRRLGMHQRWSSEWPRPSASLAGQRK